MKLFTRVPIGIQAFDTPESAVNPELRVSAFESLRGRGAVRGGGQNLDDADHDTLYPHVHASAKLANIRVPSSTCDSRQWWSIALFLFTQHTIVVEKNNRAGAGNVGADGTAEPPFPLRDFSTQFLKLPDRGGAKLLHV